MRPPVNSNKAGIQDTRGVTVQGALTCAAEATKRMPYRKTKV